MTHTDIDSEAQVRRRIDGWRRDLIDLSHRNRLIAYSPTQATTLTIAAPSIHELLADPDRTRPWDFFFPAETVEREDAAASDAASAVDEAIVRSQQHRARSANEIEVTERSPKRIARILDNLAKRSNSELQDKALRILYLAAGFLDWHDRHRDRHVSSPLVLVPIELRRDSTRQPYRLRFVPDEEIVVNPSLTEKLRRDAELTMPGEWTWEDKPIAQELEEIRRAVAGTGWTVRDEAVIGLFSFQKHVMYRDLVDNEERVAGHPMVRSLALGHPVESLRAADAGVVEPHELDDVQDPEHARSILDADASQRQCIEAAKRGRSFVMQGPPGTGKSQTISNVITEAIGQGKRVLFVSEKAAALDVVHRRLTAAGVDDYCLMLHGERAGRREVVLALDRSLTSALQSHTGMRGEEMTRLAALRKMLNGSVELLHESQPLLGGHTVRQVHERLAELHEAPAAPGAPVPARSTDQSVLDEYHDVENIFQHLSERWHVSRRDYPWRGYDADHCTADDQARIRALLHGLSASIHELGSTAAPAATSLGLAAPASLAGAEGIAELGEHLVSVPPLHARWMDVAPDRLADTVAEASAAYDALAAQQRSFDDTFPARRPEELSSDLATRLRDAESGVRRACGWSGDWEHALGALPDCVRALDGLPGLIDLVRERAQACCALLGQPSARLTARRLDELAELAELAFSAQHRPQAVWLVRAGLDRALQAIDAVGDDLSTYQRQREALLERYTVGVLDLDATLAARLAEHASFVSKLGSGYRRDAKAVKAVCRDGKLPPTVLDDLRLAASTRAIGERIGAATARMTTALGASAAGRDTDVQSVREALSVAQRVIALSDADADLATVGRVLAAGSEPDPAMAQAAHQLEAAKARLVAALACVERFTTLPGGLFQGTLDELATALPRISTPICELAALVDDLNAGAASSATGIDDVRRRAEAIAALHDTHTRIARSQPRWRETIGGAFAEAGTDWQAVTEAGRWLARLNELTGGPSPAPIRSRLLGDQAPWPDTSAVGDGCVRMRSAATALTSLLEPQRRAELDRELHASSFERLRELGARMAEGVDGLHDWTEWQRWRRQARDVGWEAFLDGLVSAGVVSGDVVAAFQHAFWSRRLEALYDDDPELAEDLHGAAFQRWVGEFRELDRRLVKTGSHRLIAGRPRIDFVSSPGSEVQLLRHEARKKKRHLPVRKLLARIPTLLSELKPCLMMSPLTVSHFLSPEHAFDLVIFDEASQVPPQDAVNCVYRGDQLIVAGDSRQLPPTSFFQIAELDELSPDEEDEGTEENMESILDLCEAVALPSHSLLWHYRSRSEPLIAFSNREIYDESLVTFPSPTPSAPGLGIAFTHVADGIYDRGGTACNRREAQVVAGRVVQYLREEHRRSVGVIAFNSRQSNAIAEELDLLKLRNPDLEQRFSGDRLDAVFVKHLEAVQGDERDVIILSVGYGRDGAGRFTMNFGPLNKDGGQRRLNVAITRARDRLEVVSSVRAEDFTLSDGPRAGARLLRDYVAYAQASGHPDAADEPVELHRETWPSALEEQVAAVVEKLGFLAVPRVGVGTFRIDIGVRARERPDEYLLGIECDGAEYARTPTARDRERLRHEVLDALGWGPIHRMWSLDWVRNQPGEVERLREALQAALGRQRRRLVARGTGEGGPDRSAQAPQHERVGRVVHELDGSEAAARLPWTRVYVCAKPRPARAHHEFHEASSRREQIDLLTELMDVEAPIGIDYAIRRLAEAWDLRRVGNRVAAAGRQAIRQASSRGLVEIRGEFLWRPGQTLTSVRIPDPFDPPTRRAIEDVPPEEIDLAIASIRDASAGIEDEQLIVQVARVLGFDRTGGRIRTVLDARVAGGRRQ